VNHPSQQKENPMKKTAIVVILGLVIIVSATCFHAFGRPPGPPAGPPSRGEAFGGPPGPPPFPPPRGGFFGGPPGPPPPHGPEFFGLWACPPHLIEKLKLTDDQLKEMRLAYVNFLDKTRKARNALRGLRDEKKTMLISGKIDQAKLAKLDDEITTLASNVTGEDLKMKREQLSILKPEQVDRFAKFLAIMAMAHMAHGPKMMGR
jgi:protein CpxP